MEIYRPSRCSLGKILESAKLDFTTGFLLFNYEKKGSGTLEANSTKYADKETALY